jgi:hypothetical protein
MYRDSMPGNPALAMFEAMLMIIANLLAEAGARIGYVPAWAARPHQSFPQADDAPAAPDRRRGSLQEVHPPPSRYRPYSPAPA